MNRRGFLKGLAALPAAPALPYVAALAPAVAAAPVAAAATDPRVRKFLAEAMERAINPPVIYSDDGGFFVMDTSAALRDVLKAYGKEGWLK